MGSSSWGLKQCEEVLRVYVYVCVYSEDEKENHQEFVYIRTTDTYVWGRRKLVIDQNAPHT